MELALTLAQARKMYEDHFKKEMPTTMPYKIAAGLVFNAIGKDQFIARYKRLDLDGNYRKQFTIYKDVDDNGVSYTVYDNDLDLCMGQYLADDPDLHEMMESADILTGLDNREQGGN